MMANTTAVDDDSSCSSNNNNTLIALFVFLVICIVGIIVGIIFKIIVLTIIGIVGIVGIIVLTIEKRNEKRQKVRYDGVQEQSQQELTLTKISPMENDKKLRIGVLKWFKEKHEENKEEQLAILLATGSFNPIHTGHVDMMNFAKKELESLGKYTVIGGFMSPSHDSYVSTKGSYIGSDDRIEMIKLAVEDSDWIECDEWECEQPHFVDFPQVCEEFQRKIDKEPQFLDKILNSPKDNDIYIDVAIDETKSAIGKISLFYVCGFDHCNKCGLWNGVFGGRGLVAKTLVVPRPDSNKSRNNNQGSENCIVVNVPPSKMTDDRSSTQIRKYIQASKGDKNKFKTQIEEKKILHPKVLQYIENRLSTILNN